MSALRMRPVLHWVVHRIHAHVAITLLGLLLERVIEHECGETWRNVRDALRQINVAHFSTPNGAVWQTSEPREDARNHLTSRKIPSPPTILKVG
jgi:hypothetical protein